VALNEANEWERAESSLPFLIVGVGNILLGDEGVGVRLIEAMAGQEIPDSAELFDGGTASIDLLDVLANRKKVIIVDAVKGGNEPGTVYRFTPDDIEAGEPNYTSLHQVGLLETLTMARYLDCLPQEIIIYGIEPKDIAWGLELSPEVAAVVPKVIKLVLGELGSKHA